jgi:ribosomal protein S18 acetylase RimI-like enzyme
MSQLALRIRDATEADLPTLSALLAETTQFHAAARPDVFAPLPAAGLDLAYLSRYLADGEPDARIFVAEQEVLDEDNGGGDGAPGGGRVRAVLGMVQCAVDHAPQWEIWVRRVYIHVEDLVVAAAARSRGVGRALMARAEDWAREREIPTVELNVFSFNVAAQRLYEDLGYRTSSSVLTKQLELGAAQTARPPEPTSSA